jgi:ABC-2 type transport system permease protein
MKVIAANIMAIYRRELQSYFQSPSAYIIAAIFWFLLGIFLVSIVQNVAVQQQLAQGNQPFDAPNAILQAFLLSLVSMSMVILPMLSMNLYTEERKRGTLELLGTSPITNWSVAVGKLVAVSTLFLTLLLPVMVVEGVIYSHASPAMSWGLFLVSHLGVLLLAVAILSLGLFISSLTDRSVVAAIVTFSLILLLWVVDLLASTIPGWLGDGLTHLSMLKHFTILSQGVLETGGIMLFLSYIILGIFLTAQSIDLFRFQQ